MHKLRQKSSGKVNPGGVPYIELFVGHLEEERIDDLLQLLLADVSAALSVKRYESLKNGTPLR